MCCMISKWLEIPLRYPMSSMSSRSVIRDDISVHNSPRFTLWSRGTDRTRFEYAVYLLNKNLEQILNSQRLDIITLRHTLPNLVRFLSAMRVKIPLTLAAAPSAGSRRSSFVSNASSPFLYPPPSLSSVVPSSSSSSSSTSTTQETAKPT